MVILVGDLCASLVMNSLGKILFAGFMYGHAFQTQKAAFYGEDSRSVTNLAYREGIQIGRCYQKSGHGKAVLCLQDPHFSCKPWLMLERKKYE